MVTISLDILREYIDYNEDYGDQDRGAAYYGVRCAGHAMGGRDGTETIWDEFSIDFINMGYEDAKIWMRSFYEQQRDNNQ